MSNELNKLAKKNTFCVDKIYGYFNNEIKDVDELGKKLQKVVIFDDYINDKNQDQIINYFIQEIHKNCSVIYLSHSYYKTHRNISHNCDHFIVAVKTNSGVAVPTTLGTCEGCSWSTG